MNIPAKKLVKLLSSDGASTRTAALVVAGEIGFKDSEFSSVVLKLLDDVSGQVRLEAVRTAGKLRIEKALPTLLDRIGHGGSEGAAAAKSAALLGPKGVKALQEILHKVVPGVRKYIAIALAETGVDGTDVAAVDVFRESDPAVTEAAAQAIAARIPEMTPARKKGLASDLVKLASAKKSPIPPSSEAAVIRLLSALNDPSTASYFWDRTQAPHPADVRAVAIQTVGGWIESPTGDQWKKLFACASESDFRVVGPALLILERLPYSAKQLNEWMALFQAPDVAARRLAVQKLGEINSSAIAAGLVEQLTHHDRGLKDAARAKLTRTDAGRTAYIAALLMADHHEEAWVLARGIAPVAGEFSSKLKSEILKRTGDYIESGNHLADPLLFLLKEADPTGLRDGLYDRAVEYRKKKKYETALAYLKLLGRDPGAGFPVRFELACVGLKLSPKQLDRESRVNDASLSQFGHAANADLDETVKQLDKAKWIDADDLFYVGFHFAEDLGRLRSFGAACLKLSIARSPKGKTAQNAKTKLKTIAA
jgi:HEAT repeat protein